MYTTDILIVFASRYKVSMGSISCAIGRLRRRRRREKGLQRRDTAFVRLDQSRIPRRAPEPILGHTRPANRSPRALLCHRNRYPI